MWAPLSPFLAHVECVTGVCLTRGDGIFLKGFQTSDYNDIKVLYLRIVFVVSVIVSIKLRLSFSDPFCAFSQFLQPVFREDTLRLCLQRGLLATGQPSAQSALWMASLCSFLPFFSSSQLCFVDAAEKRQTFVLPCEEAAVGKTKRVGRPLCVNRLAHCHDPTMRGIKTYRQTNLSLIPAGSFHFPQMCLLSESSEGQRRRSSESCGACRALISWHFQEFCAPRLRSKRNGGKKKPRVLFTEHSNHYKLDKKRYAVMM